MKRVYAASFLSSCIDEHDEQHNIGLMNFANIVWKIQNQKGQIFFVDQSFSRVVKGRAIKSKL